MKTTNEELALPAQEELSAIFITKHKMNNMDMERIVINANQVEEILLTTKLNEDVQVELVEELVDTTPEWLDLESDMQMERIKQVLTCETVICKLQIDKIIRRGIDLVESHIDQEGSVVIEAYYTNISREERRKALKSMSKEKQTQMKKAVKVLSGEENLVDLATKKLEKMKKNNSKFRGRDIK